MPLNDVAWARAAERPVTSKLEADPFATFAHLVTNKHP
jgi:hypothetical protein